MSQLASLSLSAKLQDILHRLHEKNVPLSEQYMQNAYCIMENLDSVHFS